MITQHASTCQCHECQAKRTPAEQVTPTVMPHRTDVQPEVDTFRQDQNINELTEGFTKTLEAADRSGSSDFSLTKVWKSCMKFHDDNALLRANLLQMQVMLQGGMETWAKTRTDMAKLMNSLDKDDPLYMEKYEAYMRMNEKAVNMVNTISTVSRDLKKEIRMTEFQSRFFFHVNLVQMFMTALTGVLFKHLQSSEKKNAIVREMGALAKMYLSQEEQHKSEEDGR